MNALFYINFVHYSICPQSQINMDERLEAVEAELRQLEVCIFQ